MLLELTRCSCSIIASILCSMSQHLKIKQTVAVRLVEAGFILVNAAYKSRDDIVLQRVNPFLSLALFFIRRMLRPVTRILPE